MIFIGPEECENFYGNIIKAIESYKAPEGVEKFIRFETITDTEYYHTGFIAGLVEAFDYDDFFEMISHATRNFDKNLPVPPVEGLGPYDNAFWTELGMQAFMPDIEELLEIYGKYNIPVCAHIVFSDEDMGNRSVESRIVYRDDCQVVINSPFSKEYDENYIQICDKIESKKEEEHRIAYGERIRNKTKHYQEVLKKGDERWTI